MKSYLLVFNEKQASRGWVKDHIDSIDGIDDWITFFDNTFCFISELSVTELSKRIRAAIPDVQFIVTTLDGGKRNGWLPKSVWTFMNRQTSVPAEPAT
jgi:hypothetical protein